MTQDETNTDVEQELNTDLSEELRHIILCTEAGFRAPGMAGTVAMRLRAICAVAANYSSMPQKYGDLTLRELVIIGNRQRIWGRKDGPGKLEDVVTEGRC